MFPSSFVFGTATSSTQVDGRVEGTDWLAFASEKGRIKNGDSPDIACESWTRFREDIALQRRMGLGGYRCSIEWARVEPRPGEIDRAALDHYRELLGAMRDAGIEPMVTLHHFTLPLWMARPGGLLAADLPGRLARFAREVVLALGDLCDTWITINEPSVLAAHAYLLGLWPPARKDPIAAVRAHHRLLEAHVAMYRAVHAADPTGRARVGVAHPLRVIHPAPGGRLRDRAAAAMMRRTFNDSFALALCEGRMYGGPADRVRGESGISVADARGTQELFGLNYYSRDIVRFSAAHAGELFVERSVPPGAPLSDLGWEIFPEGISLLLREWGPRSGVPVYVTENGIADADDSRRARFIVDHLAEVERAIADGIDVRGYYHWSLLDNFEWAEGYAPRFGLAAVDRGTRERTLRGSGEVYARIARARSVAGATYP